MFFVPYYFVTFEQIVVSSGLYSVIQLGASLVDWLDSLITKHLPYTTLVSIQTRMYIYKNILCEETIQLAYGRSVVLPRPLVHK